MVTTTQDSDVHQPGRAQPTAKSRIGLIVAASLAAGLIAAVVLVAAPFVPAEENAVTGVVLLGFALGWALLAVLSTRFSGQPQRWARPHPLGIPARRGSGRNRIDQVVTTPLGCALLVTSTARPWHLLGSSPKGMDR
jgi:hypothetical protein